MYVPLIVERKRRDRREVVAVNKASIEKFGTLKLFQDFETAKDFELFV